MSRDPIPRSAARPPRPDAELLCWAIALIVIGAVLAVSTHSRAWRAVDVATICVGVMPLKRFVIQSTRWLEWLIDRDGDR